MAKKELTKKTGKKVNSEKSEVAKKRSIKSVLAKKNPQKQVDGETQNRSLLRKIFRSPFRGYFVSSWQELKKVTWPDRKTSWKLTFTVIMFSVIFSAFTAGLDVGFEKLAKQIFLR